MIARGTTRFVVCVGPLAFKIARNGRGMSGNRFETRLYRETTPARRAMLCPSLWCAPFGVVQIMRRATVISEEEAERLWQTDGFPDWDYVPPDDSYPWEHKAADWGRLPDGRLVALDYATAVL